MTFSCLSADGKGVKRVGRKAARERVAAVISVERQSGEGLVSTNDYRGVSVNDPVAMAALRDANKNIRELLVVSMSDEANTLKQIEQNDEMLCSATKQNRANDMVNHLKQKKDLYNWLEKIGERKRRLTEESDRLLGFVLTPVSVIVPATPVPASVSLEGSEVALHLSAGTGFTGRNLSSATKSTKSANTSTDLEESDAEEDNSGTLPGEDEENYNIGQMRRQDSMAQEEDNDEEDDYNIVHLN